jgi:hypothetical protein
VVWIGFFVVLPENAIQTIDKNAKIDVRKIDVVREYDILPAFGNFCFMAQAQKFRKQHHIPQHQSAAAAAACKTAFPVLTRPRPARRSLSALLLRPRPGT